MADEFEGLQQEIIDLKIRLRRIEEYLRDIPSFADHFKSDDASDPMLTKAIELVQQHKTASASYIQRSLSIGYSRAARILDQLEEKGVVGPVNSLHVREVLKRNVINNS